MSGRRLAALVVIGLASCGWIGTAAAAMPEEPAPIEHVVPAGQQATAPMAQVQQVAQRRARRGAQRRGRARQAQARRGGRGGCFHGVGKFGGGCR